MDSRQGKRARTRARILGNAIALFRSRGVGATRLADVARETEIAPATLFNHFPTRARLASAWVRGEIGESAAAQLGAADGARPRRLRVGLRALCRDLAEKSAPEAGCRLEAWGEADRLRTEPLPPALVEALRVGQADDRIRADRSATGLADLLMDAIEGGLLEGLAEAARSPDPKQAEALLRSRLQDRVDIVLDGVRKRNERVRPARRADSRSDARPEGTPRWS